MKNLASIFLLISSCLTPGQSFTFKKNDTRSSKEIKQANIKTEVISVDSLATAVKVTIFVKTILGPETRILNVDLDNGLLNKENTDRIRSGEIFHVQGVRVFHDGYTAENCDLIKADEIPDDEDTKNLVVTFTVCQNFKTVEKIDASFESRRRKLNIGFDYETL